MTVTAEMTDEELFAMAAAPEGAPAELGAVTEQWVTEAIDRLLSYDERKARLDAQYMAMAAEIKSERAGFEERAKPLIEAWFDAQPKKGKSRSLKLLTGTLSKRLVAGGPSVADPAEAFGWAVEHLPAAIAHVPATQKLMADVVRDYCKANGSTPPGVEWRADRDEFYIKAPKAAKEEA